MCQINTMLAKTQIGYVHVVGKYLKFIFGCPLYVFFRLHVTSIDEMKRKISLNAATFELFWPISVSNSNCELKTFFLDSKIFFRTFEPLKCIANHWCVTGYLKLSFSFRAIYCSFFGFYYSKHWIQRESDAVLKVFMLEAIRSWIFLLFAFVVCG